MLALVAPIFFGKIIDGYAVHPGDKSNDELIPGVLRLLGLAVGAGQGQYVQTQGPGQTATSPRTMHALTPVPSLPTQTPYRTPGRGTVAVPRRPSINQTILACQSGVRNQAF